MTAATKEIDWEVEYFNQIEDGQFEAIAFDKSDKDVFESHVYYFTEEKVLNAIHDNALNSWHDEDGYPVVVDPMIWFTDIATNNDKLQLFKILMK